MENTLWHPVSGDELKDQHHVRIGSGSKHGSQFVPKICPWNGLELDISPSIFFFEVVLEPRHVFVTGARRELAREANGARRSLEWHLLNNHALNNLGHFLDDDLFNRYFLLNDLLDRYLFGDNSRFTASS